MSDSLWNWSYRQLLAVVRVLGTEPRSSGTIVSSLFFFNSLFSYLLIHVASTRQMTFDREPYDLIGDDILFVVCLLVFRGRVFSV